ncbi:MAG: hypothetical protein QXN18_00100 [Nitrososphaerota archaeon]
MSEEYSRLMSKILKAVPGISSRDIEELVEIKLKENPYLNKIGAILLVAEELGVFDIREKVPEEVLEEFSYTKIGDLVPGLSNISVKGVIYAVIGPIVGRDYRLLKLKIGDNTGTAEVYVWEDKIEEVENLSVKMGDHIAIVNGYTKEKLETGAIEIHLKKTSIVKKILKDPSLPDFRQFYKTIGEVLERGEGIYDIKMLVISIIGERTVTTKRGEVLVVDLLVSDGQKEIEMTAWGEKTQLIKDVKIGEEIYITDVRFDGDRLNLTSQSTIIFRELKEELLKIVEDRRKTKILLRVVDIQPMQTYTYITVTDGEKIIHILSLGSPKIDLKEGDYIELSGINKEELYEGRVIKCRVENLKKADQTPMEIPVPNRTISLEEIVKEREPFTGNIITEGILYTKTNLLTIETRYGLREKILFWIRDGDVAIQGIAWRMKASEIAQIPEGKRIRLKWITIKLNPFNEPEIHVESYSKIEEVI